MPGLVDVPIAAIGLECFEAVLSAEQMEAARAAVRRVRAGFDGRRVWNVNSTARGGGVAEMLNALMPYVRGSGIDVRWVVMEGDDEFFRVTKRIHNHLHGSPGDAAELGDAERARYGAVTAARAEELCDLVEPGDVVVLHDPQTAGLVPALRGRGVHVVWRCHVGLDLPNRLARNAWAFLLPYVTQADACVFSRRAYAWDCLESDRITVIPPSIDPFSAKNAPLDREQVRAILSAARVDAGNGSNTARFRRRHGGEDTIRHRAQVVEESPVEADTPLVVQVSRWDALKDPAGVVDGFVRHVAGRSDAHLMLAGPSVDEVADDPEGAETYRDVRRRWERLPARLRARVHLACLPMRDDEENGAMVNALQRRAQVVVQKSLAEGFGLTVAEAMWKARPVVATRIGGIQDQVEHGTTGLLVDDPRDLAAFGEAVSSLLREPERAEAMGEAAQARVRDQFLGTRHLAQFADLLSGLVERSRREARTAAG